MFWQCYKVHDNKLPKMEGWGSTSSQRLHDTPHYSWHWLCRWIGEKNSWMSHWTVVSWTRDRESQYCTLFPFTKWHSQACKLNISRVSTCNDWWAKLTWIPMGACGIPCNLCEELLVHLHIEGQDTMNCGSKEATCSTPLWIWSTSMGASSRPRSTVKAAA